jgi:ribosomal protein S18 acetylase RimI-like enzyme
MGARVRPAIAADASALAALHVVCWQEAYAGHLPQEHLDGLSVDGRRTMWERLLADEATAAAFVADDFTGFVAVDLVEGQVSAIYVRASAWSTGLGRALMAVGLERLAAAGFDEATLWVLDTNERAIRFYDRGGWTRDGAVKLETIGGRDVTEVRYRRSLP